MSVLHNINKLESVRVLIAEDMFLNQKLLTNVLRRWGCAVEVADNGQVAVGKLMNKNYEIILMDLQMPVMDGCEAAKIIRNFKDPAKANIPIIAITAFCSSEEETRCLKAGMNAYLPKPFDQSELFSLMEKLVFTKTNIPSRPDESLTTEKQSTNTEEAYLLFLRRGPSAIEQVKINIDEGKDKFMQSLHTLRSILSAIPDEEGLATIAGLAQIPYDIIKANKHAIHERLDKLWKAAENRVSQLNKKTAI